MSLFDALLNGILGSECDGVDWYCDECGVYMNNQPGFSVSSGEWTCTECGAVNDVTEDNIIYDTDEDDDEYDDEYDGDDYGDGIPEGCAACGGPYPQCCTSCPVFDD